jgi:invasion protein IalB
VRQAVFAALLACAVFSSAAAQTELLSRQLDDPPEPVPALQRDGPWLQVCEAGTEGERCWYEQTATTEAGDEVVLMLIEPPPGQPPIAILQTPLGVLLTAGLRLTFDGASAGVIAFRTCNRFGCSASVPLEGRFRSLMAQSNNVTVAFASPAEEIFEAQFSLSRSAAILNDM